MSRRLVVTAVAMFLGTALVTTVARADERVENPVVFSQATISGLIQPAMLAETAQFVSNLTSPKPSIKMDAPSHVGPKFGMGAVYASTALMHALDVDSTLKALKRGAVEANPLMSGVVNNRMAFIATKAAIAAGSIYATSRIARSNKLGAIIAATAMNSAYAMIVRNNYAIARR
jgi:hypothetical protein